MLKEDHATMMTQFLIAGLITKCCSEVEGTPVSPGIEEMQKFAVKAARCQYNQRQESLVVIMQVTLTVGVALHLVYRLVNQYFIRIEETKLTMTTASTTLPSNSTTARSMTRSDVTPTFKKEMTLPPRMEQTFGRGVCSR
jgi:hypothetical protein